MIQSKAIDIFKTMSRNEFTSFGKFLDSPAFNPNKNLRKLFLYIGKHYPHFTAESFTKENAYRFVYGTGKYDDTKTRKLLSNIYKETERFLVVNNILKDKKECERILMDEMDVRKLDSIFKPKYDSLKSLIEKDKLYYFYFLEKYMLEWRYISFNLDRGMQNSIAENIYTRSEYLIMLFLSDLFLSLQDINANSKRFNIYKSPNLAETFAENVNFKAIIEYIDKSSIEDKSVIKSYYLAFLAFRNFDEEKYYYDLKEHVLNTLESYNQHNQRILMVYLISYCNRKIEAGEKHLFKDEVNRAYEIFIRNRLYKIEDESYIRSDMFLNIISNYTSIGKTEEAERFLHENIELIQPAHRKNVKSVSAAQINFVKGNYGDSLKNTSLVKSNTFLFKDTVRLLSMKNHFELGNYEMSFDPAKSYREYISGNINITESQRAKRLKFLHYYNILWKLFDNSSDKKYIKEQLQKINVESSFTESEWIAEKLNKFLKK